ncbi:MAG: hypothetical protein PVH40_06400, partial [Gemmatimonadales bacterium]
RASVGTLGRWAVPVASGRALPAPGRSVEAQSPAPRVWRPVVELPGGRAEVALAVPKSVVWRADVQVPAWRRASRGCSKCRQRCRVGLAAGSAAVQERRARAPRSPGELSARLSVPHPRGVAVPLWPQIPE